MLTPTATTYTIRGTVRGALYWPIGAPAETAAERVYTLTDDAYTGRDESSREDGIRGMAERTLDDASGDYSDAPVFLADAVLIVTRHAGPRTVERAFDLAALPSVADLVAADEWPEYGDE